MALSNNLIQSIGLVLYSEKWLEALSAGIGSEHPAEQVRLALRVEDLFDRAYQIVADTNPAQYTTSATRFLDEVLPEILEGALRVDAKIIFCAATDYNGYVPVHNRRFSLPQGRDPAWNAANTRNRCIFDDRTGLSAARSMRDFLVQSYMRDMGGEHILMKDISTPIRLARKHWGALRIGVQV